ncbi:microfibril associated protein 5 [Erpetoichthys calabaricus]|uniref:Microfibrillar-associated protein 5-like n=1 Tax=Erpetoichthys calabaricus TaxID=27687 RepID=A0A8C4SLA1_ERPCA|nr:microfibril associated protein 5 [Erpetoichthys calabaricus]
MNIFEAAVFLCGLQAFLSGVVTAQETHIGPTDVLPATAEDQLSPDCREEQYPCTRMYSVHYPLKQCIHTLCFYSLRRMYVVNKEICSRVVCLQDDFLKAELCREKAGWPRRMQRSAK